MKKCYSSFRKKNILLLILSLCCLLHLKNNFFFDVQMTENKSEQTNKEDESVSEVFESDMKIRKYLMNKECRKHGLDERKNDSLHQPYAWEYLIAKHGEVNLVWCNIFKSASSSWMYLFNRLAGYTEEELKNTVNKPLIALAREKYSRPSVNELIETLALPNTIGFLIARNPYERLVSGYRDKILGEAIRYKSGTYAQISRTILWKYRRIDLKLDNLGKIDPPSFTEFVKYIVDEVKEGNELDMHWTPAYSFCNPCQVNLTHIIKLETFNRDTHWIVEKANLSNFLPNVKKLENNHSLKKNAAKDGQNTSSIFQTYLRNLSQDLLNDLNKIYKVDFDIFGYQQIKDLNDESYKS